MDDVVGHRGRRAGEIGFGDDVGGVEGEVVAADVAEERLGPIPRNGVRGRGEREARHGDAAAVDAARPQREHEAEGAARHGDDVVDAEALRHGVLEAAHQHARREPPAAQARLDVGEDPPRCGVVEAGAHADGALLQAKVNDDGRPYRLPAEQPADSYEQEILGTSRVRTHQIASNVDEFARG